MFISSSLSFRITFQIQLFRKFNHTLITKISNHLQFKRYVVQYNIIQYNIMQYNTIQFDTVNIIQHNAIRYKKI